MVVVEDAEIRKLERMVNCSQRAASSLSLGLADAPQGRRLLAHGAAIARTHGCDVHLASSFSKQREQACANELNIVGVGSNRQDSVCRMVHDGSSFQLSTNLELSGSDLQAAKIRNAGPHHFQFHFDEVILYAAGFRGGEDFLPVERVLSHGHDLLGLCIPALHVHGNKSAGIFREVFRGVVAFADRRDLKLELDQLRIKQFKQEVVGALTVYLRELKILVMQT